MTKTNRRTWKKVTGKEYGQYKNLAKTGHSIAEIAQIMNVKPRRVKNAFYNRGTSYKKLLKQGMQSSVKIESVRAYNPSPKKSKRIGDFAVGAAIAVVSFATAYVFFGG